MTLIDKKEIILGDYNTAKVLNTFFSNIVSNLDIAGYSNWKINREEILGEILKLETSKVCQDTDIPTKIIKENTDIFADVLLASS